MGNSILIGMPGAGKSTIGVLLAKELKSEFIDTDLIIQRQEKKRLYEIIRDEGLEAFRRIEESVCLSLVPDQAVVATGGSVVYYEKVMARFLKIGTVIYLKGSYDLIESRLGNLKKRGIVLNDDQTLADLYNERTPLYEKYAQLVVSVEQNNIELTLQTILELLRKQ
ncbi:MAG: shikimate kinase [Lachnospiraceae bacterium]